MTEREAHPQDIEGTTSQPEQTQVATPGGDAGPARSTESDDGLLAAYEPPERFKDVLDDDPVAGGSSSIGEQR